MLTLLRKVRRNLIQNMSDTKASSKIISYFFYALGEIVLVVIGILIAVGINGKYTDSRNDKKVQTILRQMQQELLLDMTDARRICGVFIQRDSLAQAIYNDEVVVDTRFDLGKAVINDFYVSFTTKRDAYNRLMQNLEILPEKYHELLPMISYLYIELQNDIDDYNAILKNTVINNKATFQDPRAADIMLGKSSLDETIDFFLRDPFLKNNTISYLNDLGNITQAANNYRIKGIELYKKIDRILGHGTMVEPEIVKQLPYPGTIAGFTGNYSFSFSTYPVPFDSLTVSIKIENRHLISSSARVNRVDLYWDKDTFFFEEGGLNISHFYRNANGQRTMEVSDGRAHYFFTHSDDL